MPISLKQNEIKQAYIYLTITPSYTLNEWYESISTLCVMMSQANHPINLILDLYAFDQVPMDIVEALNYSTARFHKNHAAQVAIVKPAMCVPMQTMLNNTDIMRGTAVTSSHHDAINQCESIQLAAAIA